MYQRLARDECYCVEPQPQKAKVVSSPVEFTVTPDTLHNVQEVHAT